jgi:hypothetical protein
MERFVLVACPELFIEDEGGAALRTFAQVIDAVGAYCPWVAPVRPGVCTLPARGPARLFGGEMAVADLVHQAATSVSGVTLVHVGVADGLFAARLAADAGLVIPPGDTRIFLSRWPVATLERPDLTDLLRRLGIVTLGDFAALSSRHVIARLGADGARCHRVVSGLDSELPGYRDSHVGRRLAALDQPTSPSVRQRGFWGGSDRVAAGAIQALGAIQSLVGTDGVQMVRRQGGRTPLDQAHLVTWSAEPKVSAIDSAAPWPGRLRHPRRRSSTPSRGGSN